MLSEERATNKDGDNKEVFQRNWHLGEVLKKAYSVVQKESKRGLSSYLYGSKENIINNVSVTWNQKDVWLLGKSKLGGKIWIIHQHTF